MLEKEYINLNAPFTPSSVAGVATKDAAGKWAPKPFSKRQSQEQCSRLVWIGSKMSHFIKMMYAAPSLSILCDNYNKPFQYPSFNKPNAQQSAES